MAITKTIIINAETEKAQNNVKALSKELDYNQKEVKQSSQATKEMGSIVDSATGGMVSGFKSLTGVLKTVSLGFRSLSVAIASTGLGLLVITITSVTAAFKSSERGQNMFAKLMGVIGTVVGNATDILADFGEALINVTTGNFAAAKKSFDSATDSIKKFGKETRKEIGLSQEIADKRAKADKIERDLIVQKAEAERKRAELLEKAQQRDKFSQRQRTSFLQQASKIDEEITKKQIFVAKLRSDAITEENKLSKTSKEAATEEANAKAALIDLEADRLTRQKEVTSQIQGLKEQEKSLAKSEAQQSGGRATNIKEASDKEIEILKEKLNEEELTYETQRQLILKNIKLTAEAKAILIKEINNEEQGAIKKNNEEVLAIEMDYKMKLQDMDATTELAKIELEEKRARERLSKLKENKEAEIELEKYYTKLKDDLKLEKEAEDFEKELEKKEAAAEDEELSFEDRLMKLQEQEDLINATTSLIEEQKTAKLQEIAEKRKDIEEEAANFKEEKYRTNFDNLQNILSVGGKNLQKISKALAIADVVRTASKSVSESVSAISAANTKSIAASPLTGGMPFVAYNTIQGALQVGSTIASATKSIQAIASESKTVSGGGTSSGGGSAPPTPPSFNLVQGTGTNQIAEGLARQNQPLKAYVVASEVSTQQSLDRNIQSNASI